MTKLNAHRDRFLEYFSQIGTVALTGWHSDMPMNCGGAARRLFIAPLFKADYCTLRGEDMIWNEPSPEVALYLALSHAALPEGRIYAHFSKWGAMTIEDPHKLDLQNDAITSSLDDTEFARFSQLVAHFNSNHGQFALSQRLEPMLAASDRGH